MAFSTKEKRFLNSFADMIEWEIEESKREKRHKGVCIIVLPIDLAEQTVKGLRQIATKIRRSRRKKG